LKVCFFSPTAYAYFFPDEFTWAGGAEMQQILVARYMVSRGIDVSFIVGDYGQDKIEVIEGIRIIKSFKPFVGNRKLRFIPDMYRIFNAMKIADADIYNQRSTSFYTGQLSIFASILRKKFTFSIGSDYNCFKNCGGYLPKVMCTLYKYGIKKADAVIAQTISQQKLMMKNFSINPVLIRNGIYIPEDIKPIKYKDSKHNRLKFLWVGSIRKWKRPELYIDLARQVPDSEFVMIGGLGDDTQLYEKVKEETAQVHNINYIGFVPPDKIGEYYRTAYAYINTSSLEGFPNTYLQSWLYGVPTLTIQIDPDNIIKENGIGIVSGSFENLISDVKRLIQNPLGRDKMSDKAFTYVRENHRIESVAEKYINLFEKLLKK